MIPNVGPWEGWRIQAKQFFLRCAPMACATPTVVVLFPSPNGVGVILHQDKNAAISLSTLYTLLSECTLFILFFINFLHTCNSPKCRTLCSDECFSILDHASTAFQVKIKEVIHIQWVQPTLNHQLYHVNQKLSF